MKLEVSHPFLRVSVLDILLTKYSTAEDKNNKLMSSEGLEATEEEMDEFINDESGIETSGDQDAFGFE